MDRSVGIFVTKPESSFKIKKIFDVDGVIFRDATNFELCQFLIDPL